VVLDDMNVDATGRPDAEPAASHGVWASGALVLAGNLAILGSFSTWDTCPDSSCHRGGGALMALWETSGVEFGPGIATVVLGILLVVVGLWALRAPIRAGPVGLLAGSAVVLTTVAFYLRMHVFTDERYYGPDMGLFVVPLAGLIATFASQRLAQPARDPS
jgi:hypothetical protein